VPYRLLTEFENLFNGHPYRHRDSSRGDFVAMHLYEDIITLNKSTKLRSRARSKVLRRGAGTVLLVKSCPVK
jgi:hypothetical protein